MPLVGFPLWYMYLDCIAIHFIEENRLVPQAPFEATQEAKEDYSLRNFLEILDNSLTTLQLKVTIIGYS